MKLTFTIGLGMLALAATAQHQHQHDYSKSVFYGSQNIQPLKSSSKTARMQQGWQAQLPGWRGDEDAVTGMPRNIYGAAIAIPGATLNDKVQYCTQQLFPAVGLTATDWQQLPVTQSRKATFVRFQQIVAGHKVTFAQLTFRFTADNSGIVQIENRSYGTPDISLVPAVSKTQALQTAIGDITGVTFTQNNVADEWVWFPIPSEEGYTLHPAWYFTANGNIDATPVELSGYIDAIDGKLLYRSNAVKETFDLTVKGNVFKNSSSSPATLEPLANLKLKIGSNTYYTDALGLYTNASLNVPQNVTIPLEGRWSTVNDVPNNRVPSTTRNVTANGTTYTYPANGQADDKHINAYYHVNRVHDFMKDHLPTFTGMDFVLPTNVDVTGSCNAFYTGQNGGSINFYAAGNGCNSFAEIGDVIYHEYGHGISDKFYTAQSVPSLNNGALNEGNSDVWAMSITHSPFIGVNAYPSGGYIRRYDLTPKVYPMDIEGEVHADGEIIAGAWWDVSVNINSIDTMGDIFTESYYSVPDGPSGTEGKVYYDVLIAALQADDNDNNIINGTPHFVQIVSAFAKHGIYLMAGTVIAHTEVAHQPAGSPVTISATVNTSYPDYLEGLKVIYRKRGSAWDTITLNKTGLSFQGQLPAFAKGDMVDYYFQVNDVFSTNNVYAPLGYNPANASTQNTIPYQFAVGVGVAQRTTFDDGAATASGWSIGNNQGDNATDGLWEQVKPVPSYYQTLICQVDKDHTTGSGQCLVTGNASSPQTRSSSADVDGGLTTVLTPIMDLSRYKKPVIEYYRWFSNDRGSNARNGLWMVQIRNASNTIWKAVEQTYQSDYNWRRRVFTVTEFFTVLDKIQLKFTASDPINNALPNQGQSTVEAALDDFFIYDDADALGVAQIAAAKVGIYPNPADQSVRIVLPAANKEGDITVFDLTGRVVAKIPVTANVTDYTINTATLPAGNYMLLINSGHMIQSGKLSVMH